MLPSRLTTRRHVLAGLGALGLAGPRPAFAQSTLFAADFGVLGDSDGDQTIALQSAIDAAAASGQALVLPPGAIFAHGLVFPGNLLLSGTPGRTVLTAFEGLPLALVQGARNLVLRDIGFQPNRSGLEGGTALLRIVEGADVSLERCSFRDGRGVGIEIVGASASIVDCDFSGLGDAAIHALDSTGLVIRDNLVTDCGNAGIRIWRSDNGPDGSIVTGNRIERIDWRGGGNGQNGNGINIYLADAVIISGNHIADCAFSAVRLNSTNNSVVSGNLCLNSGEVAIFSEFAFSGSVIADNIVDGAAFGISMTNFDQGGQLATCSGNVVRNITPTSLVNPDTTPGGIFAEANAVITGNTVQNVPGIALGAGHGPYLDNVAITSNVVSDCAIGVAVSVVEDCGPVLVANNMIRKPTSFAAVGLRWTEVTEPDLFANAGNYPHVSVDGNVVAN